MNKHIRFACSYLPDGGCNFFFNSPSKFFECLLIGHYFSVGVVLKIWKFFRCNTRYGMLDFQSNKPSV